MTASASSPRLLAIMAGLTAVVVTVAVIAAAPPSADAQELEEGLEEVEGELDGGGGTEPDDPTDALEGQDPTEELGEGEDLEQPGDGGDGGGEEVDAQQLEEALAGLEEAVSDALGDNADEGGQQACETALESFFTDPAEESFESALQTCLDAVGDDLELDDETLQDCQADFEGFLSNPDEETLQAAVDACLQSLLDLADSGGDGGEPDAGAEPGQDDGRQVDEVPGAVQTGGTGTPTDGAQAAGALALFAGLTAAGTMLGRRRLGGAA